MSSAEWAEVTAEDIRKDIRNAVDMMGGAYPEPTPWGCGYEVSAYAWAVLQARTVKSDNLSNAWASIRITVNKHLPDWACLARDERNKVVGFRRIDGVWVWDSDSAEQFISELMKTE